MREGRAMAQNTAAGTTTPYRIEVHHLETCNCDPGCNCNFGGFPDHGFCQALVGMQVIEGTYGGVDLAGVKAVFAAKWPKAIHEGHGQASCSSTSPPVRNRSRAWR
jgi:hypothetical protein